jgi:hypothetical protein
VVVFDQNEISTTMGTADTVMGADRDGQLVEKGEEAAEGSIEKETVGILNVREKGMIVSGRKGGGIETGHWSGIEDDHVLVEV